MWEIRSQPLTESRGFQRKVSSSHRPASFQEVLAGWREDAAFRSLFDRTLADIPYLAFRWETPAVSSETSSRPFECVVLDSPGLDVEPDRLAFAEYFQDATDTRVVTFPNLGKDAILVVPTPLGPHSSYTHLAAFVREAPDSQRQAFWTAVGQAAAGRLGSRPVWINTAGAGVAWLHVRLDDRPKYYFHEPYRRSGLG